MNKRKKRISLGRPLSELEMPRQALQAAPVVISRTEIAQDSDETQAEQRPGIEHHPLFWFTLGALTVGIIVLLGLLLLTNVGGALPTKSNWQTAPDGWLATPTASLTLPGVPQASQPDVGATITAYIEANRSVPRISIEETRRRLEEGSIIVVDVRSKSSYDYQHIKEAISIPSYEAEVRLSEFPKDKDIVLYCA